MSRSGLLAVGLVAVWPLVVVPGFVVVQQYASAPGQLADPPSEWPDVSLSRADGRATLVMLAHPRCPCTRASLAELARLMASVPGALDATVLFSDPAGAGWRTSDLWAQAEAIPGVRVEPDPDGAIAQAFGAYTSGQVLVYGADGGLLFNGGITASRGHEGDNPGRAAIVARLRDQVPAPSTASVFGCALDEPERGSPSPVRTLENSR